jgi:hypothetical protein
MILFSEKQRFTQWWLWVLLAVVLLDPIYMLFKDPASRKSPMAVFLSLIVPVLVVVLFRLLRMETRIMQDCIQFRFFPFHWKFRNLPKKLLSNVYVKKYRPLMDYGGWGIRWNLFGKGRAYNVSGNEGIQIEFKDGRKLLIGTQEPDAIAHVLLQAGFPTR